MLLTFGPDRQTRTFTCECCEAPIERSWNMVHADGAPYALYYANCYHHRDRDHDAWIDVVFGTWGQGAEAMTDHVSFGCRVGPVLGQTEPAATLVDAGTIYPDGPLFGRKLDRAAGLVHPQLRDFWAVVDYVLANDPLVNRHLYS
ncbi:MULTISPECIES: hypothetical protein [Streptomyces]|uniref:hypothetical protein n=1 Tax=Streptomyces TaxID=1883 RepID=UPI00068E89A9|nr:MULTISPECIES: hypothetical protein [Streptomyces]